MSGADLQRRLEFLALDASTRAALTSVKPTLDKALPGAMADFYDQLSRFEETRGLFDGGRAQMDKAAARQVGHWGRIAAGQFDGVLGDPRDLHGSPADRAW